eukprot:CAMPEP_0118930872 /NCGR_PEP_ID=MMETSP1169-20130426/7415_1 /TAXON_ID=36882 /ORGANISM="Pyramimonas obovata, Strain CCMP722" /LENGTH=286 /DNA_ID=CAMNT_0006873297 /DNA_START=112 /DNA_END=968 /DNA_ORIENTATION=-
MGERKVLNKYIPPDFDPAAVPRRKKPKDQQIVVRMMLPMSIRCNTCGNYIYKGTKFNCRKEDAEGEDYLGIRVFRFYFKCTRCSAELAMKTDPKHSDYIMEAGATRNFEPWREKDAEQDIAKAQREADEAGDAMKALENRTLDSKREMDILSALDEMKALNSRHATVNYDDVLDVLSKRKAEEEEAAKEPAVGLTEEDEAVVRAVFKPEGFVRRIEDDDKDGGAGVPAHAASLVEPAAKKPKLPEKPEASFGIKKRGVKFAVKVNKAPAAVAPPPSKGKAPVVVSA